MKKCLNCGELIGDNVSECFNCHYNYIYKRIITQQERKIERDKKNELIKKHLEDKISLEKDKEKQIKNNPIYEYDTVVVNDNNDGTTNKNEIQNVLNKYSQNGWKLHSITTNEVGKTLTGVSIGFIGGNINATICQTILIFERCIKS